MPSRHAIEPVGGSDGEGDAEPLDKDSKLLDILLSLETIGCRSPIYEDIPLIIVRHPITGRPIPAIAIKFIHYNGSDNKLKLYVPSRAGAFYSWGFLLSNRCQDSLLLPLLKS